MRSGRGEVPDCHTCVMGLLSVMNTIRLPAHWDPHVSAAAVMAYNSRYEMDKSSWSLDQDPWIHQLS